MEGIMKDPEKVQGVCRIWRAITIQSWYKATIVGMDISIKELVIIVQSLLQTHILLRVMVDCISKDVVFV